MLPECVSSPPSAAVQPPALRCGDHQSLTTKNGLISRFESQAGPLSCYSASRMLHLRYPFDDLASANRATQNPTDRTFCDQASHPPRSYGRDGRRTACSSGVACRRARFDRRRLRRRSLAGQGVCRRSQRPCRMWVYYMVAGHQAVSARPRAGAATRGADAFIRLASTLRRAYQRSASAFHLPSPVDVARPRGARRRRRCNCGAGQ